VKHGLKLHLVNFYHDSVGNSERPEKLKNGACAPTPSNNSRRRHWWIAALFIIALAGAALMFVRREASIKLPRKSVAVLPFQSLSDEHRDAYFADGVQDEILTALAKVADLKVISRTSVMKYRQSPSLNLRQIAEALRVRYVLEGSVQRVANNVRVSAQLLDATTDAQIWAEHYDRQLSDVFAIQSEIAEKIVSQLQAKLTPEEKAAIEVRPTDDIQAYDLYVKAKAIIDRVIYDSSHIEDLPKAARLLEEATARDPHFFLAFCKLAYAHDQIYFNSLDHTPERLALAQAALDNAQRLQPDAGEYHLAAAAHYYFGYLEYDRARQELVIAQRKMPNDPYPILLLGYIDRRQGRWKESTAELEKTIELDPRNLLFLKQLALSYNILRRYPEMKAILDRAVALAPNDPNLVLQRAGVDLEWRADTKPLHEAIDRIMTKNPANAATIADQWIALALCENDAEAAKKALASMSEQGCQEEDLPYPKSWCEGLAARNRKDTAGAQAAFTSARAQVARIVSQQPDFAAGFSALGMIDAALGNKEDAISEGRKAVELLPASKDAIRGPLLLQNLAIIYAWTGETDFALAQLRDLVSRPCYLSYGQLRLHPYWEPLRKDEAFNKLVAELAPKDK
jgi:serine/threonine-protein kinase